MTAEIRGARAAAFTPGRLAAWAVWATIVLVVAGFVGKYVFHYYLNYSPAGFQDFWPRRAVLLTHITAGSVAICLGPWQLWTGLRARFPRIHPWTGRLFLVSVAAGIGAGAWLAVTNTIGWAYGLGLASLDTAWAGTTAMAWYAIRCGAVEIHRRWMIRAYVVTFGFVTFRLYDEWLPTRLLKPDNDRVISEGWACWALPLLATLIVQGVLDLRARSAKVSGAGP